MTGTSKELREQIETIVFARFYDIPEKQRNTIVSNLEKLFTQQLNTAVVEAEERGANNLHRYVFNHFKLLPKIQGKTSSLYSADFNEANYQAIVCDYLATLKQQLEDMK